MRMKRDNTWAAESKAPRQEPAKKLLYNLEEAGALLSLSSWTVRDYVKTGVIKSAKVPHPFNPQKLLTKPILIHRDELESFAEKCKIAGAA